jgi:hypothetical protein
MDADQHRDQQREDAHYAADNENAAKPPSGQSAALYRDATPRPQNRQLVILILGWKRARSIGLRKWGERSRPADCVRPEDVIETLFQRRCRAAELLFYFRHARARS